MRKSRVVRDFLVEKSFKGGKLKNSQRERGTNIIIAAVVAVFICASLVCLVLFLIKGEITITGSFDENDITERLVCESNKVAYPLFDSSGASGMNLKINATFSGDTIYSIALIYKLEFADNEDVQKSESVNHAIMNLDYRENGLSPDSFDATYGKLKDGLQLSLYATGNEVDGKALKYFMLDKLNSKSYSPEKVAEIYNKQGLNCELRKQQGE